MVVKANFTQDQYIQKWHHDMQLSSRGKFYSTFKENLCFEKYLIKIPCNLKIWITKLRTYNLKIPIETGRWRNIPVETGRWRNIPVEERICDMCNENIGDEIHYLFICKSPELVRIRENIIPEYYTRCPNKQKLSGLLSYCNVNLYKKISSFIKKLNNVL